MAVSNEERVLRARESLKAGLTPYVEKEMQRAFGKEWKASKLRASARSLDSAALLNCMWDHWNAVFGDKLSQDVRNYVSELRGVRNRSAHEEPFSLDDAYRALDTAARLLRAVSAPEADDVDREMQEIMLILLSNHAQREQKTFAPFAGANRARMPKTFPLCECGCGEETAGGRFRPGHDAKLKSRLIKTARAEGENKDASVCEAAWNELVELGWSHMFDQEMTRLTAEMNRNRAARRAAKTDSEPRTMR